METKKTEKINTSKANEKKNNKWAIESKKCTNRMSSTQIVKSI